MSDQWYILDKLGDIVVALDQPDDADRAGRYVAALSSTLADTLSSPSRRRDLAHGARRATAVLDQMRRAHRLDEASPSFLAGRLATIVDVLSMVVSARTADDLADQAREEIATLRTLYKGPRSNVEVAEERRVTEEAACRSLRRCREIALVETSRQGRTNVNRLTPIAIAMFDDGILKISDTESQCDMHGILRRTAPANLGRSAAELPQLMASPAQPVLQGAQ